MFGISTFAQTTFAGLGTNAFQVDLTENVGMADNNAALFAFLQSITENVILDDLDETDHDFLFFIDENISVNDTPQIAAQFSVNHTETYCQPTRQPLKPSLQ